MHIKHALRDIPGRVATGAFILNAGMENWGGDEDTAKGIHQMAASAFPYLEQIPPPVFLKMLAVGEMGTGSLLLAPFVPSGLAGLALTGFSGSLLTMYMRNDALHRPGSPRPTQDGVAVAKDVWMLGIGLGLLLGAALRPKKHK